MMNKFCLFVLVYFAAISLVTSFLTVLDKILAKKGKRRISEATLLTLAIMGGAAAEYLTMKAVHHKTLHKKFMIGLPVIIFLQAAVAGTIIYFVLKEATI